MIPFLVMLSSLILFWCLGLLGLPWWTSWQDCVPYALAVLFLFTAGSRLTPMREDLAKMVPSGISYPQLLVSATGILEALGAIGLLIPSTRRAAALGLALMLIAIFPANVNGARNHIQLRGKQATPLWLRLPMQLVYIGLAIWSAFL